ncbi:MAG: hypothetical protein NTX99_10870, partial [Candidatus Aminicenantes bacterium]|nr:hypothetical protein [Candidatus Aminicenantes bacterium]
AVTPAGFGRLTASLMAMAEPTAKGRLALVLEGGYDLPALREGVREVLKALGTKRDSPVQKEARPVSDSLRLELEEPLRIFRRKWDIPSA